MKFLICATLALALLLLPSTIGSQEHDDHAPAAAQHTEHAAPAGEHAQSHAATTEGHGAAGHGEGHEEDHHAAFKYSASVQKVAGMTGLSLTGAYWLSLFVNFAVVAAAILWAWRKYAPSAFSARTAAIQKGMEEARRASEEANRRLSDVETRLSRLDSEISSLRADADAEAAREEANIRAAAEAEKAKVVEAARQEVEAAGKQARHELKAYAAGLAVSLAEQRIRVDAETDRALVGNFVEQLGNGRKS
ncbi:MAG: hypothetical protein AB7O65_01785 [Candidatus Korobacteraceae bacterium]